MVPIPLVATLATAVVTVALGAQVALTPISEPAQPAPVQFSSDVYPAGKTWGDLLKADPELNDLGTCESGLNPFNVNRADAKITGSPSTGLFMYQPGTWVTNVRKYNAYPDATSTAQIMAAIDDPYMQIFVTRHMLDDGEWSQWYNCYVHHGLAAKYVWNQTTSASALKTSV